jgi:ABC-type uncharacterized transport system permease subunit
VNVREVDHHAVDVADLRPPAVAALLGIGAIQALQVVHTFQATPLIGVTYGSLIAACVAVVAWLQVTGNVRAWGATGLISLVAILAYALKHFVGTTFDTQDVGNWRFVLDIAPLFVEAALLALSGLALALVHADVKDLEPAVELKRDRLLERSTPASRETTSRRERN